MICEPSPPPSMRYIDWLEPYPRLEPPCRTVEKRTLLMFCLSRENYFWEISIHLPTWKWLKLQTKMTKIANILQIIPVKALPSKYQEIDWFFLFCLVCFNKIVIYNIQEVAAWAKGCVQLFALASETSNGGSLVLMRVIVSTSVLLKF